MSAQPFLVTERLELWQPQADHLPRMMEIVSHPQTYRYLGPQGSRADHFSRILRNAGSWTLYGYGILAVKRRDTGAVIGNCGIFHSIRDLGEDFDDRAEAGWIIAADQVGQGYAGEAMRAVLEWFDDAFAREVMCLITLGNAPSMNLAAKLDFLPLRDAEMPDGDEVRLFRRKPGNGIADRSTAQSRI